MEHLICFLGCVVYLIGILSSEVHGFLFQVSEEVQWSEAEQTCQNNHGKLFKPSETSLDSFLISECNSNYDVWVGATYINLISTGSASMGDPYTRCEICKIEEPCEMTCSYKRCTNNVLCEGHYDPHTPVLHDRQQNWTLAMQWCSLQANKLCNKTLNASSLFFQEKCYPGCSWVRNRIQLQLQSSIDPANGQGECGILNNGTLAFTSCSKELHPLCERVATTTLETPTFSFSEGNRCILINSTKSYMTTTQATQRTNRRTATIITASAYGASTVANETKKQTTFGLNKELSSISEPVGTSLNEPEHGALIGGVVGAGVVLTVIIIIVVVFLFGRSKQNRNRNSNSQGAVNNEYVLKATIRMNNAYDDVNGEITYSDQHTSISIQHLERDSILYATPSKANGSSEIVRDKYNGVITNGKQMTTDLYSKVQKMPGQKLHNLKQSMSGDDEYDKIKFDIPYAQQAEHAVNIYDKTTVDCDHQEEHFENMFNKAELYHDGKSMDAVDGYEKANFHGGQHKKRGKNIHSDEENASPCQISENLYDKANFHRRPQDESSGYL